MNAEPDRIELLELDVDMRLADLWAETAAFSFWNLERVAVFIRAAYAKGYCDALSEAQRGQLCTQHGYRLPERR